MQILDLCFDILAILEKVVKSRGVLFIETFSSRPRSYGI